MKSPLVFAPLAYIGSLGLPFASFGAVITTMFLAMFGFLLAPFRKFFKFKGGGRGLLVLVAVVALIGGGVWWWNSRSSDTNVKVVVVGMDGLDPKLLEQFMDQGLLPNFQKLREQGTYTRLATTLPALSPVAWASFSTGSNPGRHGLFDFLKRDPKTYLPDVSMAETETPKPWLSLGPIKLGGTPHLRTTRRGVAFWDVTTQHKIPTTIMRVPVTFPPDKVHGRMLAGLGVPDLRGTQGTFGFYTTDSVETGKAMGGQIVQLKATGDTINTVIYGPHNTLAKPPKDETLPLGITIDKVNPRVTIQLPGETFDLGVGQWSEWKTLTFKLNAFTKVKGIVQFYLASVNPELKLYLSPINFDPHSPAFPISSPANYAGKLADEIGLYHTIGQAEDTWSLNEGRVSDETFLQQCSQVIQEREAMLKYELSRFKNGLLVCSFDTPDRIQHMFWRHHDPKHPLYNADEAKKFEGVFPKLYQTMDRILGDVMATVPEGTTVIVLSDHGFSQFRTAVHTNAWLKQEGYLVFKSGAKVDDLHEFFQGVDWSKTKAYAVGLSGIYFNLQGREGQGSLAASETGPLTEEITRKLLAWVDPQTGQTLVKKVYRKQDVYEGPETDHAPDLILGFDEGYRSSWQTALGSTPSVLMEPNAKRWSGDHCVVPDFVPGVFLSNRKINTDKPRIIDVAPTILKLFELEAPASVDGRSLL